MYLGDCLAEDKGIWMSSFIAFVMDPMERVNPAHDTSFAFMLAAQARGFRVLHVLPKDIDLEPQALTFRGSELKVVDRKTDFFEVLNTSEVGEADVKAVFIRTDPPFDEAYLNVTWLLSFAERRGLKVINSPAGVRSANEKLYALEFPQLCPDTMVTASKAVARRFLEKHQGVAIAKPLDGHGGFGVLKLSHDDTNVSAILDLLTAEERQPIILQEYLPAASEGDKRLILIDGQLKGAITRIPKKGDHRGNVHVGGSVVRCEPDARDHAIAAAMTERLKADGLYFVGLDVIDGMLIEVNVTSPTLIREIRDLGGPDLAEEVFSSLF